MAADLTTVLQKSTEVLNACAPGTFSATIDANSRDRNATAISEAARGAAMLIGRAILSNPRHAHRNLFVPASATELTHQGELPDMAGELDLVQIQRYSSDNWQTGVLRDVQQVESFRNNPSNLYSSLSHTTQNSPLAGYYALSNGRFYFTGFAAQGFFPVISRSTVTGLIPDEYEATWVALTVGASLKEGDNLLPIGQYYMSFGQQDLLAISQMGVVRALPPMQKARQERGNE